MPLISVIIPAYNAEKTIQETIESVLNQTFTDFEIIVSDDGSQDSTLEIVSRINDSRLQIISHHRKGANHSRNLGLFQAVGEYVSFLDADDLWTPDKLESQLKALEAHPEAAIAYSWTDRIDESSQFLRQGGHVSPSGNVLRELLIINFLENGSNPLIRKEAAIAVGGFDETLPACQDWDMWLRLAMQYQFVPVQAPQILYRVTADSISSNVVAMASTCVKLLNRTFAQAVSLQYLKRYSLGNIYKYSIFKVFEGYPDRKKSLAAAGFLFQVVYNDPEMLRMRVVWKVLVNILITIILPPQQAYLLLSRWKKLSNVDALLNHTKLDFSKLI